MDHPRVYPITTAPAQQAPVPLHQPPALRMPVNEIPPGVQVVTLPGGVRTLAYTEPTTPTAPVALAAQPIPAWAKTTALLVPTTGFGIGAAGVGLSYAAPGLIAMSHALWAAVALIATGGTAAAALIRRCRRPAPAQITQNITATGLFGRASGTINH
ncbi:hypothetical protein [Streptomyces violens]|uniref:hypothetical protein n=1 Tax=Streptomyces violens TaxID=66377 RepID=UPI00068F09AC|nr:hypothetical protein [Streptomyces violens]